jgi:hypothetical protein
MVSKYMSQRGIGACSENVPVSCPEDPERKETVGSIVMRSRTTGRPSMIVGKVIMMQKMRWSQPGLD